jgi:hypothetical protein
VISIVVHKNMCTIAQQIMQLSRKSIQSMIIANLSKNLWKPRQSCLHRHLKYFMVHGMLLAQRISCLFDKLEE